MASRRGGEASPDLTGQGGTTLVGPDCRVVGCGRLRVVDASIMPAMVRANTHLTAVMIGELVAARLRAR